jgi:two-component system phosphate regulon sensor histidine kinase PhoR
MNKNPTPRSIAFYTALAVTFFVGLFVYFSGLNIIAISSILAFTFATTFILFIYAIEVFIYRKIKLVYKNIHNLKLKKVGPRFPEFQSSDPITDVENEVRNWAEAKFTDIEQLREMEQYRKEFLNPPEIEPRFEIILLQQPPKIEPPIPTTQFLYPPEIVELLPIATLRSPPLIVDNLPAL